MSLGREDRAFIVFDDVSKFYGEVLGVNRVNLRIGPGITSLVGPNGSGKSTLMNLMTGLITPSRGRISILGLHPHDPEPVFRLVGYSTQVDAFPAGATGRDFIVGYLTIHGFGRMKALELADRAIARVGLTDAANRRVSGYSKGMRQRIKLAQAIAHGPRVLVLDEPLNGLDPMARSEFIGLLRDFSADGCHIIVSSHILHEVDAISDCVILMTAGYVVAEGEIRTVREEMVKHPLKILVRCDRPSTLAARLFEREAIVQAILHEETGGVILSTKDADSFHLAFNEIVVAGQLQIESIAPADDDVQAVYEYLIGQKGNG